MEAGVEKHCTLASEIMWNPLLRMRAIDEVERRRHQSSTFTEPLQRSPDMKEFLQSFYKAVYTDQRKSHYRQELEKHPGTLQLHYKALVPSLVSYEDFWQRYDFRCDVNRVMNELRESDAAAAAQMTQSVSNSLERMKGAFGSALSPRASVSDETAVQENEKPKEIASSNTVATETASAEVAKAESETSAVTPATPQSSMTASFSRMKSAMMNSIPQTLLHAELDGKSEAPTLDTPAKTKIQETSKTTLTSEQRISNASAVSETDKENSTSDKKKQELGKNTAEPKEEILQKDGPVLDKDVKQISSEASSIDNKTDATTMVSNVLKRVSNILPRESVSDSTPQKETYPATPSNTPVAASVPSLKAKVPDRKSSLVEQLRQGIKGSDSSTKQASEPNKTRNEKTKVTLAGDSAHGKESTTAKSAPTSEKPGAGLPTLRKWIPTTFLAGNDKTEGTNDKIKDTKATKSTSPVVVSPTESEKKLKIDSTTSQQKLSEHRSEPKVQLTTREGFSMPLLRGWGAQTPADKSNEPGVEIGEKNLPLPNQVGVTQENKPQGKTDKSSDTDATPKKEFTFVLMATAVLGLACAIFVGLNPGLISRGLDGACCPVRPGVVIDSSYSSDSGEAYSPWWVPGPIKDGMFGLICGSRRRSHLSWDIDSKKRLRLTVMDATTGESLFSRQGLISARILGNKIEIQKAPTKWEDVEGPWTVY